jgi:hypothetical protein
LGAERSAGLGEQPPPADFVLIFLFLANRGCLPDLDRRSYNCVALICDNIEKDLTLEQRALFNLLERRLREIYLEFMSC